MEDYILQSSLEEAIEKCITENALITSDKLSKDESIHHYKGSLYYEDGCRIGRITDGLRFLKQQEWTNDANWYVIDHLSVEQMKQLNDLHEKAANIYVHNFEKRFKEIINGV